MTDLFGYTKPRATPRIMMHVADAGWDWIRFECKKCGHDTDWIEDGQTISQNKRGMPCPKCNVGGDA